MYDISQLDNCFKNYIKNIHDLLPEGIIEVNLGMLQKHKLLNFYIKNNKDHSLTRYFHVIETTDKITLVNDQFIVWIVPDKIHNTAVTFTLIALNKGDQPRLEVAFIASGCYNSSRLVLRILESFLYEIQETEEFLDKISKAS